MLYFGRAAPLEGAAPNAWAQRFNKAQGDTPPTRGCGPCAFCLHCPLRTKQSLLPSHGATATPARSNCYYRTPRRGRTPRTLRKGRREAQGVPPCAFYLHRPLRMKQPLLPHGATATTARSDRSCRTEPSLLPHGAIATTARSNRTYRTKQSHLPHKAIATTARSNCYYRTEPSLLPHGAIATTARSNRTYRTKQSHLPHEAIAPTARSNRYYRTKQSLLPHGATATTARSNRYYRTKQSHLPHARRRKPRHTVFCVQTFTWLLSCCLGLIRFFGIAGGSPGNPGACTKQYYLI